MLKQLTPKIFVAGREARAVREKQKSGAMNS